MQISSLIRCSHIPRLIYIDSNNPDRKYMRTLNPD